MFNIRRGNLKSGAQINECTFYLSAFDYIKYKSQEAFCPKGFISKIFYSLDSSRLLEVHADGGLGHLQVRQTAEVLRSRRRTGLRTWTHCSRTNRSKDLGWDSTPHVMVKTDLRRTICQRASGWDRNRQSFTHGKGSQLIFLLYQWPDDEDAMTTFDTGLSTHSWHNKPGA